MLAILFCAILLSIVAIGLGHLLHKLVEDTQNKLPFAEAFFLGLIIIGVYGMLIWFLLPLNVYTAVPLCTIGFFSFFTISRGQIQFNKPLIWWVMIFVLGVMLAAKAATISSYYDSGLYYIQTIRWMEQYAIIPGLGNIHIRLAMAAPWHMIAALSSAYPWANGSFDYLNELAYFWFVAAIVQRLMNSTRNFEKWFYILLLPGVLALNSLLSSTSPDLPNAIYFWWVVLWLYDALRSNENQQKTYFLYAVLNIAFLVCTKASALFLGLPLLAIMFVTFRTANMRQALAVMAVPTVIILVGSVKTWMLCGYAYFLVPGLNLFAPDWVVPKEVVEWYNTGVTDFARFKGNFVLMANYNKGFTWIKHWYAALHAYERLLVWLQPPAFVLGVLLVNKVWKHQKSAFYLVVAVVISVITGTVIWWIKAPDLRFHWAALYTLPVVGSTYLLRNIKIQKSRYIYLYLITWTVINAYLLLDLRAFKQYWLRPAPYPAINTSVFITDEGQRINYPLPEQHSLLTSDQCWDAPLPCAPKPIKGIQWRGSKIQQGFKVAAPY